MANFIKDSLAELEHVVWPTKRETQAYFKIVVIFIIVATIFLFLIGYLFGEAIFGIKDLADGAGGGSNVELGDSPINIDLGDVDTSTGTVDLQVDENGNATIIDGEEAPSEEVTSDQTNTPSE